MVNIKEDNHGKSMLRNNKTTACYAGGPVSNQYKAYIESKKMYHVTGKN